MGHIPPPWQMDPLPCRVAGKSIPESRNSGRTTHFHLWDTPCLDHQPIKHNIGTAGGNTSRSREVVSSSSMELPAVYRHIPRKRRRKTIGPRTVGCFAARFAGWRYDCAPNWSHANCHRTVIISTCFRQRDRPPGDAWSWTKAVNERGSGTRRSRSTFCDILAFVAWTPTTLGRQPSPSSPRATPTLTSALALAPSHPPSNPGLLTARHDQQPPRSRNRRFRSTSCRLA